MNTFALILLLTVATPDGGQDVQASVLDSGLSLHDCLVQWQAMEPTATELPNGLAYYLNPVCEAE